MLEWYNWKLIKAYKKLVQINNYATRHDNGYGLYKLILGLCREAS